MSYSSAKSGSVSRRSSNCSSSASLSWPSRYALISCSVWAMADALGGGTAIYYVSGDTFCLLLLEIFNALLDTSFQFASDLIGPQTQGPFCNAEFLGHVLVRLNFVVSFIDVVIKDHFPSRPS